MKKMAMMVVAVASIGAQGCTIVDTSDLFAPDLTYNCATALSPHPPPPAAPIAIRVDLTIPDDERLDTLTVEVQPHEGHTQLPAGMPRVALVQILGDGTIATLDVATDESADVEGYETPHDLTVIAPPLSGPPYAALAFPEQGEGAVSYGRFLGWRCTTRPAPPAP